MKKTLNPAELVRVRGGETTAAPTTTSSTTTRITDPERRTLYSRTF